MVSGTCGSYMSKRYKCDEKWCEKRGMHPTPAPAFGCSFDQKSINNRFTKLSKKTIPQKHKIWYKRDPKNGTTINTKTHQKSMPKLVTEKLMKIIKTNASLNGKIIEMHCKNYCFWCFRRLHVRTGKVSKKHQKWVQTPSENRYKNHARKMGSQKMKIIKQVIPKGNEKL